MFKIKIQRLTISFIIIFHPSHLETGSLSFAHWAKTKRYLPKIVKMKEKDGDDCDDCDNCDNDNYSNSDYRLKSYWDKRFEKEDVYDWLVNFTEIQEYLIPLLTKDSRILIAGCGNSTFSEDLYDYGFENITNIDFSEVCIENMKSKNSLKRPNMTWIIMDMTELTFSDQCFDFIIDKASMDALLVDEGDVWDPEEDVVETIDKTCLGMSRILRNDGIFIQITFAQPHFRTKYLMAKHKLGFHCSPFESLKGECVRYKWNLNWESVKPKTGCINYFIYFMKKFDFL